MKIRTAVYLALGPRRVRAALRHTTQLALDGARVLLVVADLPDWSTAVLAADALAPGVTLHRLDAATPRAAVRAAQRFLLATGGPLSGTDLLVAGDPPALPVAWAAARRRPDLAIVLEPSSDPHRVPAAADLAILTPWYPSPNDDFAGAFVRATTAAVREDFAQIAILHTEGWFYTRSGIIQHMVEATLPRLLTRTTPAIVLDTQEGELTRVSVQNAIPDSYPAWIAAHVTALRTALPGGVIDAPVVHAHTGFYAGVVAARLARPDARVVITEHATFLARIFRQEAVRRLYAEALHRADAVLCVSGALRDYITGEFPAYAGKLHVVPNPIDFDAFAVRPAPPTDLLRWLYVGRLVEHKGVVTLLEAFASVATEEPAATLTMVGSGPLEDVLRARASELGLADRVVLHPPVPPDGVVALLHAHDLLVHASRLETFGMTVVEAVATGTPVLVARSDGPAETLAGLDGVAGALVEVSDDPRVFADAFRALRSRRDSLDLAAARQRLLARYAQAAVAAQLHMYYGVPPRPVPPVAARPADGLLVIAVDDVDLAAVRMLVAACVAEGTPVDVLTAATVDLPGITVHRLPRPVRPGATRRAERLLLVRLPGGALNRVRRVTAGLAGTGPEIAVRTAQQAHRKLLRMLRRPVGGASQTETLWRAVQQLPELDLTRVTRVVVSGTAAAAVGAELARRYPHVSVTAP
jgi:glycogen(starch) synthase